MSPPKNKPGAGRRAAGKAPARKAAKKTVSKAAKKTTQKPTAKPAGRRASREPGAARAAKPAARPAAAAKPAADSQSGSAPAARPGKKTPARAASGKVPGKGDGGSPPAPARKARPRGTEEAGLQFLIDSAWERRGTLTPDELEGSTRPAIERAIEGLESGEFRVAEPDGQGGWQVNEWLKKAVLLYFRISEMELVEAYPAPFWDKVPARFGDFDEAAFRKLGARVVPGAIVRAGSHIGRDVVLMPSFVNIGAYVGVGTMVDTWATVGSCAQIGRHCHLSGGAGIGGVLEPLQATPTIIEDHCFIGARSEVVEGVIVGHHSVIGMGVFLGQSTRIYDRATGEVSYGRIPPYSVVVSGQLPAADGSHSLYCAVIVKRVDARTRSKTSINELLRGLAE
ncbi:MAG: 2,3,4,5-tetrahydropyridine-2,6-dicarboxylate N-succinyltransferase [Gammaproteobacteria bacterium]